MLATDWYVYLIHTLIPCEVMTIPALEAIIWPFKGHLKLARETLFWAFYHVPSFIVSSSCNHSIAATCRPKSKSISHYPKQELQEALHQLWRSWMKLTSRKRHWTLGLFLWMARILFKNNDLRFDRGHDDFNWIMSLRKLMANWLLEYVDFVLCLTRPSFARSRH